MAETKEWSTAPRDGREINVKFSDGNARARYNIYSNEWETLVGPHNQWRNMRYDRGASTPICWWADTD